MTYTFCVYFRIGQEELGCVEQKSHILCDAWEDSSYEAASIVWLL